VPTFNAENAQLWKELSDIDYFTQFVKAWLAFNAWMRNAYPAIKTDRELIDTVKEQSNPVRNKIRSLLVDVDQHGQNFRSMVADLHTQLENTHLISQKDGVEKRITFSEWRLENLTSDSIFSHARADYSIVRIISGNDKGKIEISVVKQTDKSSIYEFQQDKYNWDELKAHLPLQKLPVTRRNKIMEAYILIGPFKRISWLASPGESALAIGSYKFKNDVSGLSSAIIEIIYQMRCLLFHGELVPRKSYNMVYEPAYRIVKVFLDALH
jgi:hypothetical protein